MSNPRWTAARQLTSLATGAAAILLLSPLVPGFAVRGVGSALAAAALAGVLNAVLWPLVVRFALPVTVLTLGLAVLVLNGLMLVLVASVLPGVTVHGVGAAVAVVLGTSAFTTLVAAALSIDDDARFGAHMARVQRRRRADGITSDVPGVLFLEIDGLAYPVLQRALRDGDVPTLHRWLDEGTHHLHRWETDLSSQTGACQAGILHGCNDDMPAFRWWEKDRGRPIVTNHPKDAAELERRVSDGRGLLHADGASRANILSGDAPHTLLTMSTVLDVRRGPLGADYAAYFANPYNVARTLLLSLADIVVELSCATAQRRRDVRPRVHRGLRYALLRAWATAVQLDLQVEAVLGDIDAGRPVVYTTFLGYDEVAHHSGVERADTLAVLRRLDRRIARIAKAAADGPRPYEIVILSDHGQTQGTTFRDRYDTTLEAVVRDTCGLDARDAPALPERDEAAGNVTAALQEATSTGDGRVASAVRSAQRHRDDEEAAAVLEAGGDVLPEVVVMASGCLGLVSFPRLPGRVTREQVDARYPDLLEALRTHPGIGWVMVRDASGADVVIGARGEHRLGDGHVVGEDPLAPYGPRAARHVRRTAGFPHCPDVLLNSTYWPETDEVAAFEELVGSHGGIGGPQSQAFVMASSALPLPAEEIVGAEHLHDVLCGWLAALGQTAYAPDEAP